MGLRVAPFRPVFLAATLAVVLDAASFSAVRADQSVCPDLTTKYTETKASLSSLQVNSYLFRASENGCDALAATLLADGASVAARDREADTPLTRAARAGHARLVDLLVKHGADLNERNLRGSTALFAAVENNRTAIVEQLLALGAKPDIPGRSALTPLAAAAFNGNVKIVDLLLNKKADPNAVDTTGKTAIVYAAARGFKDVVVRLLNAGVDVNKRYGHDLTLLMWAAGHANDVPEDDGVALVAELLARGAHVADVDDRGRDTLMIAAELGHASIVALLLEHGASRDRRDASGKSALDLAADDETRGKFAKQ